MQQDVLDREEKFHDAWAESIDPAHVLVRESFEACTAPENRWLLTQLGSVSGLRVLELGTGAGEGAVFFALQGAQVTATDLSPGMLEVVRATARHHGVVLHTQVCSATDLSAFGDEIFDIVYAANLLHHVDIAPCLDEVLRVLRPGGRAAFWDPVKYNPAINVYRRMAHAVRTDDEHPLRYSDLHAVRDRFARVDHRFFWLTSLAVFVRFFVWDRIHPSQDRYWKRILTHAEKLKSFYRPLKALDDVLLHVPLLGWLSWNIAIVATKEDQSPLKD